MIRYKIDVLAALKDKGITTYRIRKEKLFGEGTLALIRKGDPVRWKAINDICKLLQCNVGDILEYIEDEEGKETSYEKSSMN